jgi:flagellar hook-basal body complex protein FliE
MNPLSSLQGFVAPVLRPPTPPAAPEINTLIPARELQTLPQPTTLQPIDAGTRPSFENELVRFVGEVNARQGSSSKAVQGLLAGENVPLHQAVIAMEEANVSFQLLVEVRNKLLESYQELMRMQV